MWGSDDDVAPLSIAREVAGSGGSATLIEVPGAGHLVPVSAPAALRRAIDDVLARMEPV